MSHKRNLRKEGFVLAQSSSAWSSKVGKLWLWELPTASALRKERDEYGAQLALFLMIWSRTPAHGIVLSTSGVLPPTLVDLV